MLDERGPLVPHGRRACNPGIRRQFGGPGFTGETGAKPGPPTITSQRQGEGIVKRTGPPQRRTPLNPGKPPARTRPLPRQTPKAKVPRPRYTGPAPDVKTAVRARDGDRCVICGRPDTSTDPLVVHHRRGRGSGGSSDPATNRAPNLLMLCAHHNQWLEDCTSPDHYTHGWKVHRNGQHPPSSVPVLYADGRRYRLTDDARKVPTPR